MAEKIRKLVSGDKFRFHEDGYDLDLTYITENVIAMGIPGDNFEKLWRNDSSDVSKFLNERHPSNYMIYNLSGEKYNYKKFNYQVKEFGFPDHHPPPLRLLLQIVEDMFQWNSSNPNHVAVVHCLAGRSRTGTVVSCYLLYTGVCKTAAEAIHFFNSQRSATENGVVLPSQIRYVHYFETLIHKNSFRTFIDSPKRISIKEIIITPVLLLEGGGKFEQTAWTPIVRVEELAPPHKLIKRTRHPHVWRQDTQVTLTINCDVEGDIQIRIFHFTKDPAAFAKCVKKVFKNSLEAVKATTLYPLVPLFRFTFHSSFINEKKLVIGPEELDSPWAGPVTKFCYVPPEMRFEIHFGDAGEYAESTSASTQVINETELDYNIATTHQQIPYLLSPNHSTSTTLPSSRATTLTPVQSKLQPSASSHVTVPTTTTTAMPIATKAASIEPSTTVPRTVSSPPLQSTGLTPASAMEVNILEQHYTQHQKALALVQQQFNQQVNMSNAMNNQFTDTSMQQLVITTPTSLPPQTTQSPYSPTYSLAPSSNNADTSNSLDFPLIAPIEDYSNNNFEISAEPNFIKNSYCQPQSAMANDSFSPNNLSFPLQNDLNSVNCSQFCGLQQPPPPTSGPPPFAPSINEPIVPCTC
jgi:protein-tyrosine phosphatase